MSRVCEVASKPGSGVKPVVIGARNPLAIIAGPCVLESVELCLAVGRAMRDACDAAGAQYIFKASFDKANRTSIGSSRGPGIRQGLDALAGIRETLGVPVTTDIHEPEHAALAAEVVDILQIPAFLCRQTDLLLAAGEAGASKGCAVNVKKGQFLSPREMSGPLKKLAQTGCRDLMFTERGTFFGYHRLVNDFIGVVDMIELAGDDSPPVCFDATHSTQLPGATDTTGGRPERAGMLAKAAVAAGVHAVFLECHTAPRQALSDASTMLDVREAAALVPTLLAVRRASGHA
ncbi:MAG: 3-deoxy-8-phosphooctulonate synthase [Phycisphaeraceae bacterium]|nr:3-deoxy-8-phosphooctulonate synthase [Phycisphaeraceae bacterium]